MKFPAVLLHFSLIRLLVPLVVPVRTGPARRIGATPLCPEPPGRGHQGFPQGQRGEVWLAVHAAVSLVHIHGPRPTGVTHLY